MYFGLTDGSDEFVKNLVVVDFAMGLKDNAKGINTLGVNCDSLFNSEKNKYHEPHLHPILQMCVSQHWVEWINQPRVP